MATLRVKAGVQPHLIHLLAGVSRVVADLDEPSEVWVTSGIAGQHSPTSLHYALRAVDLRTKNFPTLASKQAFVALLRQELGPQYDVVWEQPGAPQEHIHVEFDPRV